jgi:hypothetical protein
MSEKQVFHEMKFCNFLWKTKKKINGSYKDTNDTYLCINREMRRFQAVDAKKYAVCTCYLL